jgi:hypothetical protein
MQFQPPSALAPASLNTPGTIPNLDRRIVRVHRSGEIQMTFRASELAQVKAYEPQRVMHPRSLGSSAHRR